LSQSAQNGRALLQNSSFEMELLRQTARLATNGAQICTIIDGIGLATNLTPFNGKSDISA
jgi:hypothetical protein